MNKKKITITLTDLDTHLKLDGDITELDMILAIAAMFDRLDTSTQILVTSKLDAMINK